MLFKNKKSKAIYKVMVWEGLDPIFIKTYKSILNAVGKANEYRRAYGKSAEVFIVNTLTGEVIEGL